MKRPRTKRASQVSVKQGRWLRELKAGGVDVLIGPVPPQDGFWISRRDDREPTGKEHDAFYSGLTDRLDAIIGHERGKLSAAYIRGDFFRTRSEEMYVYGARFAGRVDVLVSAVRAVQRYLEGAPRWRVVVPLGDGPESAMVIYPTKIFFGAEELDEASLAALLEEYVSSSASQAKGKRLAIQARLAAVAPLLPATLKRARATKSSVFVADVESEASGPGVWIVHPERNILTVEEKYRFEPDCYRYEVHVLDGAGCILNGVVEAPRTGGLLVLWAPVESRARTIRISRGDFSARWKLRAG